MGSSTLDWCYLACGRYDVYVHGGQKLWDYAIKALIFEEAGGRLTTLEATGFGVVNTCSNARSSPRSNRSCLNAGSSGYGKTNRFQQVC